MRIRRALFPVVVFFAVLLAACEGLGLPTPTSRGGEGSPPPPAAGGSEGTPAPDESRPSDDGPPVDAGDGNFRLLISDQRNVIGDFAHLFVEIDRVGLRREEDGGWFELDVPEDLGTVDLVGLTGEAAAKLVQSHVPPGLYTRVFIHIDGIEGELKTGESTPVSLPSSKLQVRELFEVSETAVTSFVFDLTVIAAGNERGGIKYLLQPVVGESGASKRFREVRPERPEKGTLSISLESRPKAGARLTVGVADAGGAPVEGAHVTVEFEIDAGHTDTDGVLPFTAPPGTKEVRASSPPSTLHALGGELRASVAADGTVETDTDDEGLVLRMRGDFTRDRRSAVVVTDAEGNPVDVVIQLRFAVDAGGTDARGQVTFFVPEHTTDLKIEARKGDERGRLKVDLDPPQAGSSSERLLFKVAIEGEPVAGTRLMVIVVGPDGRPVEGADILVNGERAGATGGDGRLAVAIPAGAETLAIEARTRDGQGGLKIDLRTGALSDRPTVIETRPMLHLTFEGEPTPGARVAVIITGPSGRPAAEATVSINGRSVRPDRNGRVTFTVPDDARVIEIEAEQGRAAGKLRIEVRRPGASVLVPGVDTRTTVVSEEPIELHLKLDGELVPGSKLTVFVFDQNAHPVVGAAVTVNNDRIGATNDDGAVAFVTPDRASVLEIEARLGDARGGLRVELHSPEPARKLVLKLVGDRVVGATFQLVVTDGEGRAVAQAEVDVNGRPVGSTDSDGRLVFAAPDDAEVLEIVVEVVGARTELRVELERPPTDAEAVDETSGGPTTISEPPQRLLLKLEGVPFRGTKVTLVVADADGALVPEADVWVNGDLLGSTNAEGRFTFEVPHGVEVLELVAKADGVEGALKVETEARPLFLELEGERVRGAEVTLIVTYADGTRVPEANVWVDGERLGSTDAKGRLAFVVPEGDGALRIVADLDGAETVLDVEVADAAPVDETPGGSATTSEPPQRLVLKLEGEPFRGTKVTLVIADADGALVPEADVWVNGDLLGGTNAEGRFTFEVPHGVEVLELVAKADGVEGALKVETEARPLFLELEGERVRGAEVTLIVTYADGTRVPEANVWVDGERLGSTDAEGRLAFVVPEGDGALRIVADLDGAEAVLEVEVAAASALRPAA